MNSARMMTPGASSAVASAFSLSSSRVKRETRWRLPLTVTASLRRGSGSGVDLTELTSRPLHRFLGLRFAAARLRVHHGDDELVPRLGGALVRLPLVAHQPLLQQRRGLERLHHRVLVPHRVLLPLARRADGEALLHGEPLLVVLFLVRPPEELDRALGVLRVLHHHVVERGVVAVLAFRARQIGRAYV